MRDSILMMMFWLSGFSVFYVLGSILSQFGI